ncbi:MAG TPA: alpha/beta hydrolase [Kofleriaceae bacterium]|jgi:pimeloyl-ACP methyl ester carboxylesterase|nr:alpha/beta hydrolase [Kofleriaceae bacterium]
MSSVLLLHSGGLTSRQWRKLEERLTPRHRVLAPDLLGYGAERWPVGKPFHFCDDVAMLAALLDEPVHVVGHSYGGLLAFQLALAYPDAVHSIAAYEPVTFGVLTQPADAAALAALAVLPAFDPDHPESWLESFVDWWQGAGAWRALSAATRQSFVDVSWKVSQEVQSLTADQTGRARYATITAPTLILAGERTHPTELHTVQQLAQVLPHATLRVFPGMGHMGPISHAAEVNAAIAAFIDACDSL